MPAYGSHRRRVEQDAAVVVDAERARGRRRVRVGDVAAGPHSARPSSGSTSAPQRGQCRQSSSSPTQAVCASMPIREHEFSRIGLLAELPGETLRKLSERMRRERSVPGREVVREGDDGRALLRRPLRAC